MSVRVKEEQLPSPEDMWIIRAVYRHFSPGPVQFENFAAEMWGHSDPHVASIEVTRPSRDGGHDAVGEYRLGLPADGNLGFRENEKVPCRDRAGDAVGGRKMTRRP